jgi:hypothetical protein
MLFLRYIATGVMVVTATWIVIVALTVWRASAAAAEGKGSLGAASGGLSSLLHSPLILVLLTIAFGVGLLLQSRR